MGKTKVKSSSNKQFVSSGGKVNVTHPANQAKGYGGGKSVKNVGKQTAKNARPA